MITIMDVTTLKRGQCFDKLNNHLPNVESFEAGQSKVYRAVWTVPNIEDEPRATSTTSTKPTQVGWGGASPLGRAS